MIIERKIKRGIVKFLKIGYSFQGEHLLQKQDKGESVKMDGQNFQNDQQSSGSNYQDNTGNQQYNEWRDSSGDVGPKKANGMQIASLVLGILGIPGCCCYGVVGLLCGVIGLILALMGNKQNRGSGVGIGGLVCSIIAVILGILGTIYYALIIQAMYYGTGPFADMVDEILQNGGYYF